MFWGLSKRVKGSALGLGARNSPRGRDGSELKLFKAGEEAVSGSSLPYFAPFSRNSRRGPWMGRGWGEGAQQGQKGDLWAERQQRG